MRGTFRLLINGIPLFFNSDQNLPISISEISIAALLNSYYNTTEIKVLRMEDTDWNYLVSFIIEYVGVNFEAY